nr:hypothetical protein [Tanacetum cinerariifolium]
MSDSEDSAVTYTSVYTNSEPKRVFWGTNEEVSEGGVPWVIVYGYDGFPIQPVPHDEDECEPRFIQAHDPDFVPEPVYPEYIPLEDEHVLPAEDQPLQPVDSPTTESPGYIAESDPKVDLEYEDDEEQEGPIDYPMDEGDDRGDDDGNSSGDDAAVEDEDMEEEEEDKEEEEEEEEHIASADSTTVIPVVELVSSPEGTKPVLPPPSIDITTTGARISVRLQASVSLLSTERLARLTDPSVHPSPLLLPSSGCLTQTQALRITSTQDLTDAVTAAFPSLFGIRDVGYGIRDTWIDPAEAVPAIAPTTIEEVNTRVVELAELYEHDIQDFHALLEDAQDGRMTLQETVWTMEEEAYAARVAWNHSIGLSQATYQELQTHRDHMYAHETHIQTHQTQLQLQSTLIQTLHQVSETHFQIQQTAMAKLRKTDRERQVQLTETLRVVRDMRRAMSDMQKELISQREQLRRERQPGPDARLHDHQEVTGDTKIRRIMVRTRKGHASPPTNANNITPEAVQTMIDQALLRNSGGRDGSHSSHAENPRNMHTARPCYYADFMKCHPLNLKRNRRRSWFNTLDQENGIRFQHQRIKTLGLDAYIMTYRVLKKKMTDKYCPLGEVKKLKIELWNLKVRDNNIPAYTNCFQELALICTKFVSNETKKVDKYITGLPDNIYGNVKSSKPKTLDETIELANDLMDQKLRTYAKRKSDSKRKADDISKNNLQPFKRQNVTKAYNLGSAEKKTYEGNAPKCTKCQCNHPTQRNGNAAGNPDSNVVTDLMPVELGSFDAIIGMDWLRRHHTVIVCDEKLISATQEDDKPEGKQVKDVPIVQDFPEVFPENFPGLPPARPVEF